MRVGVDACCWSNRRGFGRYTRELLTQLAAERGSHELVLVVDGQTAKGADFPDGATLEIVQTREQPTQAASADGSRSLSDLWRLRRASTRLRCDLFFFPAVYTFYPLPSRIPTIVTFHDAIAESHPDLIFSSKRAKWFWKLKTWLALRQADRLLTVSQSARQQIVERFGYPTSAIQVILEGPGPEFRVIDDNDVSDAGTPKAVVRKYHLPAETQLLMYVGGISPHKNLQGLIRALAGLQDRGCESWHMVFVGDYQNDSFLGCHQEICDLCGQLDLSDRVTFTGFVSDADLVALYNAATALVLPSFNEGFGLPIIEAMACGLPVVSSNRGSLPEVVGDAGLLFDPACVDDITTELAKLLNDEPLRQRLRSQGLKRAEEFSWTSAARQAWRFFEETVRDCRQSP